MRVKVTSRDRKLLHRLEDFALLSTTQVNHLVFPGVNYRTVLRRLRKLERCKLIQRIKEYKGGMSVWFLTMKGAKAIGGLPQIKSINRNTLYHDLMVNDLRISLEQLLVVKAWRSAHYFKHKRAKPIHPLSKDLDTIPDWLASFNTWKGQQTIALEVELSYKGPSRMRSTFLAYYNKKGIKHLWYFVQSKSFGEKLAKIMSKLLIDRSVLCRWFYWSVIDEVLDDPNSAKIYTLDRTYVAKDFFAVPAHRGANLVGKDKNLKTFSKEANA